MRIRLERRQGVGCLGGVCGLGVKCQVPCWISFGSVNRFVSGPHFPSALHESAVKRSLRHITPRPSRHDRPRVRDWPGSRRPPPPLMSSSPCPWLIGPWISTLEKACFSSLSPDLLQPASPPMQGDVMAVVAILRPARRRGPPFAHLLAQETVWLDHPYVVTTGLGSMTFSLGESLQNHDFAL